MTDHEVSIKPGDSITIHFPTADWPQGDGTGEPQTSPSPDSSEGVPSSQTQPPQASGDEPEPTPEPETGSDDRTYAGEDTQGLRWATQPLGTANQKQGVHFRIRNRGGYDEVGVRVTDPDYTEQQYIPAHHEYERGAWLAGVRFMAGEAGEDLGPRNVQIYGVDNEGETWVGPIHVIHIDHTRMRGGHSDVTECYI